MKPSQKKGLKTIVNALRNGAGMVYKETSDYASLHGSSENGILAFLALFGQFFLPILILGQFVITYYSNFF